MEDLPDTVRPASESRPQPATDPSRNRRRLADLEQLLIDAALETHEGNRRRAAEEVGISLSTLFRRLRRRRRPPPPDDPAD